jgi:hypothetical protein
MNLEILAHRLTHLLQAVALPPPSFAAGMASGLLIGALITVVVLRSGAVAAGLARLARIAVLMVPPVIACLLWGAWVGIMAAKEMLH